MSFHSQCSHCLFSSHYWPRESHDSPALLGHQSGMHLANSFPASPCKRNGDFIDNTVPRGYRDTASLSSLSSSISWEPLAADVKVGSSLSCYHCALMSLAKRGCQIPLEIILCINYLRRAGKQLMLLSSIARSLLLPINLSKFPREGRCISLHCSLI